MGCVRQLSGIQSAIKSDVRKPGVEQSSRNFQVVRSLLDVPAGARVKFAA
jgi:hypothetical protein